MKDSAPAPSTDPTLAPNPDATLARWIHPSVILVATDLNDLDRLMPFAFEQARQTGARLLVLHVVAAAGTMASDAAGMPYYDPASALDFAAKELEPVCALALKQNLSCAALVRAGNPAHEIEAAARQFQADRVLLGTRSRSKLGKLLLGSVAEQVLRSVNLPVITVGPEAHLPEDRSLHEPIVLHATTLREASRPSAALACQIAIGQGAKLVLIHVLPPSDTPSEKSGRSGQPAALDSAALQELRRLATDTGAACGAVVEPFVVHGTPSIEILATAAGCHASLIVLGARHRSIFENMTRDRTVYRVLAHARCPVLTLRETQPMPTPHGAEPLALHSF